VLILDEGTANLDSGLLSTVWRSVTDLEATRIVATHQLGLFETMDALL
jgi:ABC-type bacteriocin/lantibiotic exporter with double-glycine peptidase domain